MENIWHQWIRKDIQHTTDNRWCDTKERKKQITYIKKKKTDWVEGHNTIQSPESVALYLVCFLLFCQLDVCYLFFPFLCVTPSIVSLMCVVCLYTYLCITLVTDVLHLVFTSHCSHIAFQLLHGFSLSSVLSHCFPSGFVNN